jgi:hypothetical protein
MASEVLEGTRVGFEKHAEILRGIGPGEGAPAVAQREHEPGLDHGKYPRASPPSTWLCQPGGAPSAGAPARPAYAPPAVGARTASRSRSCPDSPVGGRVPETGCAPSPGPRGRRSAGTRWARPAAYRCRPDAPRGARPPEANSDGRSGGPDPSGGPARRPRAPRPEASRRTASPPSRCTLVFSWAITA